MRRTSRQPKREWYELSDDPFIDTPDRPPSRLAVAKDDVLMDNANSPQKRRKGFRAWCNELWWRSRRIPTIIVTSPTASTLDSKSESSNSLVLPLSDGMIDPPGAPGAIVSPLRPVSDSYQHAAWASSDHVPSLEGPSCDEDPLEVLANCASDDSLDLFSESDSEHASLCTFEEQDDEAGDVGQDADDPFRPPSPRAAHLSPGVGLPKGGVKLGRAMVVTAPKLRKP